MTTPPTFPPAKLWDLMTDTVEAEIAYGLRRADKHADDPLTPAQVERVQAAVYTAVTDGLAESFSWPE
jgi:hypothetical protein